MARNKFDIDETIESEFKLGHLKRCFVYVKKQRKRLAAALLMNMMAMLIGLVTPLFIQRALDVTIPEKNILELAVLSATLLVFYIAAALLVKRRSALTTAAGQSIICDIRKDLFAHLQKLPFSYYDGRPHGKILVRVVNYVNSVSDMMSNGFINLILDVVNLFLVAGFMLALNAKLALVAFAGAPILIAGLIWVKPRQRRSWQSFSAKSSNLNAYLSESINGVKITQLFNREKRNEQIFSEQNEHTRKCWNYVVFIANTVWFMVENLSAFVVAAIYVVGMLVFVPSVSVGTLIAMANYTGRFWQPINNISQLYNSFISSIAYLERIFDTMDEPVLIADRPGAVDIEKIEGRVEFKNVTFAYEKGNNVLENLSFSVNPGESIALVGPTGAGKTTIVNLLSRFYDVTEGEILVDGKNISEVTLHSLRSQMGIMLQDSFLFSETIASNIKYGKLDASDEEVEAAAMAVNAHSFVDAMPKKYETEVKERGAGLSQGQRQLISFARTFISDPRILILDEATSAIDTKTELEVQRGINMLLSGRTSFVIAHRLSTIRGCDRIMYIADKGIAEAGTHEELMEKKGLYYNLYISQL